MNVCIGGKYEVNVLYGELWNNAYYIPGPTIST